MTVTPIYKRKFVVGDIRGALGNLKRLLDHIQPTPEDYFVFLGGNLGPGENSKGVLEEIIRMHAAGSCVLLEGCTEYLLKQCAVPMAAEVQQVWEKAGAFKILESYAATGVIHAKVDGEVRNFALDFVIPEAHLKFLDTQAVNHYEDADFPITVCHAFSTPGYRDKDFRKFQREVVFGHYPQKKPFREKGKIGIDLGSGYEGGKLCAFEMFNREFIIVG